MKLIKPYFEIIEQNCTLPNKMDMSSTTKISYLLDGIYKQIELAGRTCYKSEDKITETSAKEFTDRMIKSGHGAMLEHGTVYLKAKSEFVNYYMHEEDGDYEECNPLLKYYDNPYSRVSQENTNGGRFVFVTTNLRVIIENGWRDDLKYLCEPTEYHEKRITVKFICDRVTGESFLRHRAIDEDHPTIEGEVTREMESDINSFARESTRYCNYTKSKFDKQFTIIMPPEFYDENTDSQIADWGSSDDNVFKKMCQFLSEDNENSFTIFDTWYFGNLAAQWSYNRLIGLGWQPQQARRVIPLDIKSPLVMTAFVSDWEHFFSLRDGNGAHPQATELAKPLHEEFIKRGYCKLT